MKELVVTFCLLVTLVVFGQEVDIKQRVNQISAWCEVAQVVSAFYQHPLDNNESTAEVYHLLALRSSRLVYDSDPTEVQRISDSSYNFHRFRPRVDSVLIFFDRAIDLTETNEYGYREDRLFFLEEVLTDFPTQRQFPSEVMERYRQDLDWLKQNGYRELRQGPSVSLVVQQGMYPQVGAEVSLVADFQPRSRNYDRDFFENAGYFVAALKFGYMYHPMRSVHDLHVTLFELSSPFHMDITQFGFSLHPDQSKNTWFYRPQLGYSFERFSLFYSYNLVFKKSQRNHFERHMVGISFQFIPIRFKNRVTDKPM